jgi:uncharacterized membrane protein
MLRGGQKGRFWSMARVSVGADLHVASPPEDAYHVWNQRYLYPRFLSGVLEVEELDETWSRWLVERSGQRYSLEVETTDNVPRRLVAWRDDGPGRPRTTVRLSGPVGGPTVVSVEVSWHPAHSGSAAVLEADHRLAELEADLRGFRDYLSSELGGYVDALRSLEQLPHTD